jgi:hypothetical protein
MGTSATTRTATSPDTEANGSCLHLRLAAATRRKIERAIAGYRFRRACDRDKDLRDTSAHVL